MAAGNIRALNRAALGTRPPAVPPPKPQWVEPGFRQQRRFTLRSTAEGDGGRPAPGSPGRPEGAATRPASEELTAAERRIAELHAAACAVRRLRGWPAKLCGSSYWLCGAHTARPLAEGQMLWLCLQTLSIWSSQC
ncbi:uncharacterized protein C1orf53 homolog isoform X2 [Lemur catta]|uniref:uncharacterized protein C1orf53 homolog isoform X2 n=1 Tax=Lemur catta TaxID=9447 RepID=UPI001E2666AE|nr:uncharacterized protein C1orf53 homolog isoform X2 [Lemur catta]